MPINYKNLDYEIETPMLSRVPRNKTRPINYKNLDYEIETQHDWCDYCEYSAHRSTIRISITRLKRVHVSMITTVNKTINYKNLDYEIETVECIAIAVPCHSDKPKASGLQDWNAPLPFSASLLQPID